MNTKNILEDFDISKVKSKDKLNIVLSVRISKKDFEWLKANRVSASKLFNYFLHKVIESEEKPK